MFRFIKQVLLSVIGLLNLSASLATRCMSLNNEPCMTRLTLIALNPVKLNYYPHMISLDKCNGSCNNAVDDLSKCKLDRTAKKIIVGILLYAFVRMVGN